MNIALNFFINVKDSFIAKFGKDELYKYDPERITCIEYWIAKIN